MTPCQSNSAGSSGLHAVTSRIALLLANRQKGRWKPPHVSGCGLRWSRYFEVSRGSPERMALRSVSQSTPGSWQVLFILLRSLEGSPWTGPLSGRNLSEMANEFELTAVSHLRHDRGAALRFAQGTR